MKTSQLFAIDVPATAGIILPMVNHRSSTLNTTQKNLSSLAGDATLTSMVAYNLTITPGTSGRWVKSRPYRSGYYFDGSTTGMTNSTHYLHGCSKISLMAVFIPTSTAAGTKILVGAYVDGTHYVALVQSGTSCFASVCDGTTEFKATISSSVTANQLHAAFLTWDKDANSGKVTCTVFNVDTQTLYSADSATGCTSTSSADDDLWVGCRDGSTQFYAGIMCRVTCSTAVKWTSTQMEQLYDGSVTLHNAPSDSTRLWEFAEQYGTTAYDSRWLCDGPFGRAIYLSSAASSYLNIADDADLEIGGNDFTIAAYVYVDAHKDYNVILSKATAFQFYSEANGKLYVRLYDGSWKGAYTGSSAFSVGAWHAFVFMRTSNVVTCFIDGVSTAVTDGITNTVMANSANAWKYGYDGANGITGRVGLAIVDPSVSYGAQWAKDFYHGLPVFNPDLTEPQVGPSKLTFGVQELSTNEYKTRFSRSKMGKTQILAWMGNQGTTEWEFWRGTVQAVRHQQDGLVMIEATDPSQVHTDTYYASGLDAGTIASQDLYTTMNAIKDSTITLNHTSNPLGAARKITVPRGTTKAALMGMMYDLYGIPGYIDPWGDHWLRKYQQPATPDGWTEATTGWTITGTSSLVAGAVGTNAIQIEANVGSGGVATMYRAITLDMDVQPFLEAIIKWSANFDTTPFQVQLQSSAGNYYYMSFQGMGLTKTNFNHLILKMPDAYSNYGWSIQGSPDRNAITQIKFTGTTTSVPTTFTVDGVGLFGLGDSCPTMLVSDDVLESGDPHWARDHYADRVYSYYTSASSPATTAGSSMTGAVNAGAKTHVQANMTVADDYEASGWTYEQLAYRISLYQPAATLTLVMGESVRLRRGDPLRLNSTHLNMTDYGWAQSVQHLPHEGITVVSFGAPKRTPLEPITGLMPPASLVPALAVPFAPLYYDGSPFILPASVRARMTEEELARYRQPGIGQEPAMVTPSEVAIGLFQKYLDDLKEKYKYAGRFHS